MELLKHLSLGPKRVSELAETLNRERSLISHALQQLRQCHIVTAQKRGREVYYTLNSESPLFKEQTGTIFTILENHAKQCCETCIKHGDKPFEVE